MASPTLSCPEIIDLALLGRAGFGPVSADRLVDDVQAVCRPRLQPTTSLIEGRIERAAGRGEIHDPLIDQVVITPRGRARFRELILAPVEHVGGDLGDLCESLKLAFADQLAPDDRQAACAELLAARGRQLARQRTMLDACRESCPAVARCRLFQLAQTEHALALLRRRVADRGD